MSAPASARWDIFCAVVDNYGDIGVTWRLARQLVVEHGQQVRLWVDDLAALAHLLPAADASLAVQSLGGVLVCRWDAQVEQVQPADVVIEAFACNLPESYCATMRQAATTQGQRAPLWLNLEYLSAEAWVADCHGLASPQQGLSKYFFFPGFTPATGGLLREASVLPEQAAFERQAFLQTLGVPWCADACYVSLFAYAGAPLASLLQAWQVSPQAVVALLPAGRLLAPAAQALGLASLSVGDVVQRGALTLVVLPFLPQDSYDQLLWSCDFNAVRGEDSFVRAQWAPAPLLWHIYPQEEDAHLDKLEAFLAWYLESADVNTRACLLAAHRQWNAHADMRDNWPELLKCLPALKKNHLAWRERLLAQEDLALKLVQFYAAWL
ncbi:elongation factor P maturation arginine rhamnosyltransferase EarP [Atopomonas sediminilitoris]|uniref:elongation factor P maturation arginine rhamnosyltransferase EarP n=1 Tax=Atopomonas sediminilitoris TaxID=2919919 RepID=UPI001F4DBBD4|nr:elongation factor P maturation arginine rhamnosyltransferase EarP [Atopomonas sediminilitoris]MCJ8168870.1 elongation factor P maturation arginine rhamnosyltransferase EarP [Atopomonas sediminilitoris]